MFTRSQCHTYSFGHWHPFGDLVAGYVGSKDQFEFTVIGQNVNLAARIESQTKFHIEVIYSQLHFPIDVLKPKETGTFK